MSGWIRLWRQIRENPLWKERRRFSRTEAWLDILMDTHWHDEDVLLGGRIIRVQRGQALFSQRKKAKVWGWARGTTSKFILMLEKADMVSHEVSRGPEGGYTLLTIKNYEKFQTLYEEAAPPPVSHDVRHDVGHGVATVEPRSEQREEVKKNTLADTKASALASQGHGKARKTAPETDALLQEFAAAFQGKLSEPYLIEWGRDRRCMGGLVATYGTASVREKLHAFFEYGTRETRERRAWTVPEFRRVFPQLVGMKAMGDL